MRHSGRFPLVLVLCVLLAIARPIAADDDRFDHRRMITPELRLSVDRGLAWLATRQQEDGSFGLRSMYRSNPGVTGLCGLAFLASGSVPDRGPYGDVVRRTLDYVMSCATPTGYIIEGNSGYYHGPMYGHGFATLFLAEVYGMTEDESVRDVLKRAVELIVSTQNDEGGWRYQPGSQDADVSVTVCQAMALRAARNAGIAVPKETIDRCVAYLKQCQNPDGGFRYQLFRGAESEFARSAACVVALYTSGIHEGPEIEQGLQYIRGFMPGSVQSRNRKYYFYAQYYAVQAAWHADGDLWKVWFPAVRDELLLMQRADGSWINAGIGPEYATAMALLVLEVPNGFLPIFQR
ncbi:prenyltransferase/squalene oxidase repeat-containing protein [Maioricimonas sp. JC845]|uniref:prenyltransferase/squalene oxidase repeat-containing protein n=1 Tax=Maioricimonas sp. JC845 TaxID=3232138 RepID=UPI00345AD4C8